MHSPRSEPAPDPARIVDHGIIMAGSVMVRAVSVKKKHLISKEARARSRPVCRRDETRLGGRNGGAARALQLWLNSRLRGGAGQAAISVKRPCPRGGLGH